MNRKHKFDEYFHRCKNNEKLSERFCCLNRKQLGKYWHCLIENRKIFCPEKYEQCNICKELAEVFENLQVAYFFTLNKANHEPVLRRVYLKTGNFLKLRIEIAEAIESNKLVLDNGSAC